MYFIIIFLCFSLGFTIYHTVEYFKKSYYYRMIKTATFYIKDDIIDISTLYKNKYCCFAKINNCWYNTQKWKRVNKTLSDVLDEYVDKYIYFKVEQ